MIIRVGLRYHYVSISLELCGSERSRGLTHLFGQYALIVFKERWSPKDKERWSPKDKERWSPKDKERWSPKDSQSTTYSNLNTLLKQIQGTC